MLQSLRATIAHLDDFFRTYGSADSEDADILKTVIGWLRSGHISRFDEFLSSLPWLSAGVIEFIVQLKYLVKKIPPPNEKAERLLQRVTLDAWYDAEATCSKTNKLVTRLLPTGLRDILWLAQRRCAEILGDHVAFLRELPKLLRFTGGATALTSKADSPPWRKLRTKIAYTSSCEPYMKALSAYYEVNIQRVPCDYARMVLVPKNYKALRPISAEPTGNLSLQLAIDAFFKRRLRHVGIDLSSQLRNQELARLGSMGLYATIDLKSASDHLSLWLVKEIIPAEWYYHLVAFRTPTVLLPNGDRVKLEKFGPMGNGSTFTVETLIFHCLTYACGDRLSCVYGDDIVCDTSVATKVVETLSQLGLPVNRDKTHISGPYRESCGVHAINGVTFAVFTPGVDPDVNTIHEPYEMSLAAHLVNGLSRISCGPALSTYIDNLCEGPFRKVVRVPPGFPETSGIRSVLAQPIYNTKLHRFEFRAIVSKGMVEADYRSKKNTFALSPYFRRYVRIREERLYYLWLFASRGRTPRMTNDKTCSSLSYKAVRTCFIQFDGNGKVIEPDAMITKRPSDFEYSTIQKVPMNFGQ